MPIGIVKFFQKEKGFGFITPDGGGSEVFLPAAVIAAADLPRLKPGQRVSFEQAPDTKGPKVASLTLLGETPRAQAPARARLTVLYDPATAASEGVLQELAALGYELRLVDVMAAPPSPAELKKLSLLLGDSKFGLVRRYDPLFLALQLDDRFLTESEFWTGISEHPGLINGPVLATATKAGICKTREDVRVFCGLEQPRAGKPRKTISGRLAAMMRGQQPPPAPVTEDKPVAMPKPVPAKPRETGPAPKALAKPAAKAAKAIKAKQAAKTVKKAAPAKARKPAPKKAVKKSVKKKR